MFTNTVRPLFEEKIRPSIRGENSEKKHDATKSLHFNSQPITSHLAV